jgi:hypothetical protein
VPVQDHAGDAGLRGDVIQAGRPDPVSRSPRECGVRLGLRANLAQFSLLVAVNALVS